MGLFSRTGDALVGRLERKISEWKPVTGEHAIRIQNIQAVYLFLVLICMTLGLTLASGNGMAILLVLAVMVAAVSDRFLKPIATRVIYDFIGPKLGWPTWEVGIARDRLAAEDRAREVEEQMKSGRREPGLLEKIFRKGPAVQAVPAPGSDDRPIPAEDERVTKALKVWASLPADRRRARALDLTTFLAEQGPHPMLELVESAEEVAKPAVAEAALRAIALERKISLETA